MCFRDEPREVAKLLRETADLIEKIDSYEGIASTEDFSDLSVNIIDIYINITGVMAPEIDKDALVHAFL